MRYFRKAVLVVLVGAAVAGLGFAQRTTATFAGIVTDQTNAVLPGAEVSLVNEGTSATLQQLTSETGEFVFDFIPPGTYTFKILMPGFKSYESRAIPLGAAQNVRRTYTLEVGAVTDSVTVTGQAPLVNTISPEQRLSLETVQIQNLPMINRNITNIMDVGSGLTTGTSNDVGFSGTRFRLNGLGGSSMSLTADGTDANGNAGPTMVSGYGAYNKIEVMSSESVGEVQIIKGVIPAEYGSAMGGAMSLITKSGTNQYHGSLFHRYEGSLLAARHPQFTSKAKTVWNQFGGSLGGPIKRDKAFFFFAYEGYRLRSAVDTNPTVPTPYFRDILTNSLPQADIKLLLDHYPLPNQPHAPTDLIGRFIGPGALENNDDHIDVKGNLLLGSGNLSVTYFGGSPDQIRAAATPGNPQFTLATTRRLSGNYVLAKGKWTSSTRIGYNYAFFERIDKLWYSRDPHTPETRPAGRRLPVISYPGLTGFNRDNRATGLIPSYSFEQHVAVFHGTHSWKFGGILSLPAGGQQQTTSNSVSFQTLQDVLQNTPSSVAFTSNKYPSNWRMANFGFFLQDDWRVNRKLVLNLGVRYDRYDNLVVRKWEGDFGRSLSSYDLSPEAQKNLNVRMAIFNMDGLIDPVNFKWGPLRDPDNPVESDNLSIAPRVGFAYTADGKGDFVVRGGFGVNFQGYDVSQFEGNVQENAQIPRTRSFTRAEAATYGLKFPVYMEDLEQLMVRLAGNQPVVGIRFDPHMTPPYAMNYTLGIQRALTPSMVLETAFVGTRGVKFNMVRTFNQVDRITALRPNRDDISGSYIDNSQQTNYNSLQTSLKQRMTHGLTFGVHHTWGKALSYTGGDISGGFVGDTRNSIEDFDQVKIERSLSAGDVLHYVAFDWVYSVPTVRSTSSLMRHVFGGWQVSGIWRARTGSPLGVSQTGGRPDILDIDGAVNKNCCSFGNLQYLNPAAFQLVGISSASSRTVRRGHSNSTPLRGPANSNVDVALAKNFSVSEETQLELRTDMQNALNNTQYNGVSTNMSNSDFGRIISTRPGRVIQVQLRLKF
jgi:outer membrane receptor protein involved in Fe transport